VSGLLEHLLLLLQLLLVSLEFQLHLVLRPPLGHFVLILDRLPLLLILDLDPLNLQLLGVLLYLQLLALLFLHGKGESFFGILG